MTVRECETLVNKETLSVEIDGGIPGTSVRTERRVTIEQQIGDQQTRQHVWSHDATGMMHSGPTGVCWTNDRKNA